MNSLINLVIGNKFKGIVALGASVLMYYTPDHIDRIIETLLAAFGISALAITPSNKK
jgi:hypothetical protein